MVTSVPWCMIQSNQRKGGGELSYIGSTLFYERQRKCRRRSCYGPYFIHEVLLKKKRTYLTINIKSFKDN